MSRNEPSASRLCRRSTPSRVAPSFAIAACDRVFVEPVWIFTRPNPQSSKACWSSRNLQAGLTAVPQTAGA